MDSPSLELPALPGLTRQDLVHLGVLWLGGFDLRVTLLAVPPMIPAIHRDLGLDEKGISVLVGLPVLLLALAAIPGALMIARLGARRALVMGLLAIGLGSALRGVGLSLAPLFAMTLVMGIGVAVSQPAFPTLTREWFGPRLALATAVYSNGLLVGETIPASFTGPRVAPALGGSWALTFAAWSIPAFLAAGLPPAMSRHVAVDPRAPPRRWWPDFHNGQMWKVGLVMGFASAAYFGTNTFIPDFVRATGRAELKDAGLAALNTCQLGASLLLLLVSGHLVGRRWPFTVAGGLIAGAGVALVLTPGVWVVVWAGVIGFASALALVLTLALPPLLAAGEDVPRFSAGMFLIIYGSSFAGPLAGGTAWDATRWPPASFLALAAGGALMVGLVARTDFRRRAARGHL